MENEVLISIVVPAYNAAKYLPKCIESIKGQQYTNWELVVVNDGSKDNTIAIVNSYALLDKRIRLVDKENGGVSSARNIGIECATGDWIVFVDADDYVQPRYLSAMLEVSSGCDLVVSRVTTNKSDLSNSPSEFQVYTQQDGFIALFTQGGLHPPFAKLFSLNTLLVQSIRFNENLTLGEDLCFNLDYLEHCKTIAITHEVNYKYETANSCLSKNINKNYAQLQCYFFDRICSFAESHSIENVFELKRYGVIRDALFSLISSKLISQSDRISSIKELKKNELFIKYMKENKPKSTTEFFFKVLCMIPSKILVLLKK